MGAKSNDIDFNRSDSLLKVSGFIEIDTEEKFQNALSLKKAIIYITVEWSGGERFSRKIIGEIIQEYKNSMIPFLLIDCSEQKNPYIEKWLKEQNSDRLQLYLGGWGETLLVCEGRIVDSIKNPGQLGHTKTKEKITAWLN